MQGPKNPNANLSNYGINNANEFWNLTSSELEKITLEQGLGQMTSTGAISVDTGEFRGRSPKDRFIVKDDVTKDAVWWGNINIPFESDKFDALFNKVTGYLSGKDVYVRDAVACADERYKMNIRVMAELPWSSLFVHNMFLRPTKEEVKSFEPEWLIVCAPGFMAVADEDGTRQHNFSILNFTRKIALIGGTGYTGEMKKGIFSALNFILPHQKNVLSMHCSANSGRDGDTAIFFGLSGTGKTTLSADPNRTLIGDDEHGWTDDDTIFNFEGGCYAKVIDLTEDKEPEIFRAIKPGALLENIDFKAGTNEPDFESDSKTPNTRVSYPIYHIDNISEPSIGKNPKNIFFLTCDAFGVLPPISKLTPGQAAFHFISGYTAKIAGTEEGIVDPVTVFSACFGSPFMLLHPTKYGEMLSQKMKDSGATVWLLNTGWSGGPFGVGERMSLKITRALITAALAGNLNDVDFVTEDYFGLSIPVECEGVPTKVLNPINTWSNKESYDAKAKQLAKAFNDNFSEYADNANEEILAGAPVTAV